MPISNKDDKQRYRNDPSRGNGTRRLHYYLLALIIIAVLFSVLLVNTNDDSEDFARMQMALLAERFDNNVVSAHLEWKINASPNRIVLTVREPAYEGGPDRIVSQRALSMNYKGWPNAEKTHQGCRLLWQKLLDQSLDQDRFRVIAKFGTPAESDNSSPLICSFRVFQRFGFDYHFMTGEVKKHGI